MDLKKEIKMNYQYLGLTVITAALVYTSYWLNFPNSLWAGIMLVFSIMLLNNLNKEKGIEILFYYTILNLLLVPVAFLSVQFNIAVFLLIAFNIALNWIMAYGLKKKARWGFYFAFVMFVLSAIIMTVLLFAYVKTIEGTFQSWIIMVKNTVIVLFTILSLICLANNRKYFGRKRA